MASDVVADASRFRRLSTAVRLYDVRASPMLLAPPIFGPGLMVIPHDHLAVKALRWRRSMRGSALRHVPWDHATLDDHEHVEQHRPHHRQQQNGHEYPRRVECALRRQDHESQAMLGGD